MKYFIIVILIVGNIHSQTPDFIFWDQNQDVNEFVKEMALGKTAIYASSVLEQIEPVQNYRTTLTKIRKFDLNFKLIDSVILTKDSFIVNLNSIKYFNGSVYGFGNLRSKFDPDFYTLYLIKMDSDLNTLLETTIDVPYTYSPWFTKANMISDTGFVVFTSLSQLRSPFVEHYNLFAIVDTNLDLSNKNLMDIRGGNFSPIYELVPEIGDSTFLAAAWVSLRLNATLEVIDTILPLDKSKVDFSGGGNQKTIKRFSDTSYLVCQTVPGAKDVEMYLCDFNYKILNEKVFGSTQNDVAVVRQTVDWNQKDHIYSGGFLFNFTNTQPNVFFLTNFNKSLDMRWIRFYGGDMNYQIHSILAMPDGCCLAAGLRNSNTATIDADPIILKIDSTGSITSTYSPLGGEKIWSVKVYPNPVSVYLKMEFENVNGEVLITLLNADGKPVLEEKYNYLDGTIHLNLSDLPSGIYLYDVIHQNRRIAQGKVVKD